MLPPHAKFLPSGRIWPAMVAHGLWDISTFLAGGYAYPWLSMASVVAQGVFVVLGLLVYVGLYRSDRDTVVIPALEVATL